MEVGEVRLVEHLVALQGELARGEVSRHLEALQRKVDVIELPHLTHHLVDQLALDGEEVTSARSTLSHLLSVTPYSMSRRGNVHSKGWTRAATQNESYRSHGGAVHCESPVKWE